MKQADEALLRLRGRLSTRPRRSLKGVNEHLREAAVLLPIFLREGAAPELLFIVRQTDLPTHSGQIAFPGGKRETADPSLEHTALRESCEEVGLDPDSVEIYGLLDDVATLERFAITPVVGLVRGEPSLVPSQHEVADIFRAPIATLASTYRRGADAEWAGVSYVMPEFHFPDERAKSSEGKRLIWGATARITHQLLELLELLPPLPKDRRV